MSGAVHLYQRDKLVHFKAGLLLSAVAQDVGQDGLGVWQVFAEGESDRLTGGGGHCGLPLEGYKQSKLFYSKGDSTAGEVGMCAHLGAWETFKIETFLPPQQITNICGIA